MRPLAPDDVLALVGLRCSGKTSVGRALAATLGWPFADLDEALARLWAEREGAPLPRAGELLARLGPAAFRALEAEALERRLDAGGPLVLATGGGCVETAACRAALEERARCVWLRAPVEELQRRLAADDEPRPALTSGPAAGPDPGSRAVDELPLLAERRASLYAQVAELTLDAARPVAAVVEALLAELDESP